MFLSDANRNPTPSAHSTHRNSLFPGTWTLETGPQNLKAIPLPWGSPGSDSSRKSLFPKVSCPCLQRQNSPPYLEVPGLEASPSELRGSKKQQRMVHMGACGPLFVAQAVGLLDQSTEVLGDGLGSELWGLACPSDRELVLSKRKQMSWSGGSLGAGKQEQRLWPVF